MELSILTKENQTAGKCTLPSQFNEPVRPDLIKRAVLAIQANTRQKYGAYPRAGQRHSAELSRRRRKYRGAYGHGISRVPRKIMSRRGSQFFWVGAVAPGTVGGRRAHPPKAEKNWDQKVNRKERRKAIRSALAATMQKDLVSARGHQVPANYPFILETAFETLAKTKEIKAALTTLGFTNELQRCSKRKIRAGKGKHRGRPYKRKTGPLVIVADDCKLLEAGQNIPGVKIVKVAHLNAQLLAPGTQVGRLTLFTKSAIEKLEGGLFQ